MVDVNGLSEQIAALEDSLTGAGEMTSAFEGELARMRESLVFTGREVNTLTTSIGGGLRRAFDGLVFDGLKVSDALRQVAKSMIESVYSAAMKPVQGALGGLLAGGLNGAMSGVSPFAKGGVVGGPTSFAMRGGRGLMGEAGPEAIMPLTRGADGRLGVQAQGGGQAVTVVMNISTPDVAGFQRSQSQIAAEMARALGRGQRNR